MIWTVVSCWLCAPAGDPLAVGQGPEPCHGTCLLLPLLPGSRAALGKTAHAKRKPSGGPNSSPAFQLAPNPSAPIKSQLQAAPVCVLAPATKATSLSICLCGLG